jgi:hypothetical protein
MPFLAPALPLIAAGVGAAASGLSSRAKTQNTTANTTVTTPGELQPLQGGILEQLMKRLSDPSAGIQPIRAAGRNRINQGFSGVDQALRDKFLSSGVGGKSGKYGAGARATENARQGAFAGFEGDLAKLQLDREDNTLSLSQRLLGQGQGRSSTGTDTTPGNVAGATLGSLGSSLGTLATLTTLNKLLTGGGGKVGTGGLSPGTGLNGVLDSILGNGGGAPTSVRTPPFVGPSPTANSSY